MIKEISIKDILKFLNKEKEEYSFVGCSEESICGFSSLANYIEGSITWIKSKESISDNIELNKIKLAVVGESKDIEIENMIVCNNPKRLFFSILEEFFYEGLPEQKIGRGTFISDKVKIGKNVIIGHNCTVDGDITIGDNTRIYNNVVLINKIKIGENCEIQSGVNIGHDGFAFAENGEKEKRMIKHHGGVEIGNEVYIGGNSYIERGTLDNTIICDGVKIDGMCTIGHNCYIDKNSSLVGGTILFGSVKIGKGVHIASATVKNQIQIDDNAVVGMGSVVIKDVKQYETVAGVPAKVLR